MKQSVIFKGYKCFGVDEETIIQDFSLFNIFVGKNNSGKSSAINVMSHVMNVRDTQGIIINQLGLIFDIDDEFLDQHAQSFHTTRRRFYGDDKDRLFRVEVDSRGYYENTLDTREKFEHDTTSIMRVLPKFEFSCRSISAERNISREKESASLELKPTGEGATNLIRAFLHQQNLPETVIEKDLLFALNEIMGADAFFESIRVQHSIPSKQGEHSVYWEVYLQEKDSGRLPLSEVGSGLKTIILVLLNLLVVPQINTSKTYCFAFEELENNLHPALQRRLFEFIYNYSIEHNCYVFLTTHSHAVINTVFEKPNVSIYHVIRKNQKSCINKIDNYADRIALLDDLDIKASDLLQANGIIWVEGPSDRIYIKKWLEVFGGSDIQEGRDYQFVYYGGKLLKHYTAEYSPKEEVELINLLLVNHNSAIVMDSDITSRNITINATKKRIDDTFRENNLFSWITQGKEIENYLTLHTLIQSLEHAPAIACGRNQIFSNYIDKYYKNFSTKKVSFANMVKENITNENVMDLETKIKQLYDVIKSWNK